MIIDVYIYKYIVICLSSADELLLVTGGCIYYGNCAELWLVITRYYGSGVELW